ncbi:MAG: hypothetical protein VB032_08575 [Burkholderiaceae bacterium]|nr:hypothetical protein [Burkholderiaceae bacterium]
MSMSEDNRAKSNRPGLTQAWIYALVYFALANLWIVMSGNLLDLLPGIENIRSDLEVYKGLFFVLVTSAILYLLLRSWQRAKSSGGGNGSADAASSKVVGKWVSVVFLGLLVVIVTVGYLVFERMKSVESRKSEQYLAAVAKLESDDIQEKIQQHFMNANMTSTTPLLVGSAEAWNASGSIPASRMRLLRQHIERMQQIYHYSGIAVLDSAGRSIAHTGGHRIFLRRKWRRFISSLSD